MPLSRDASDGGAVEQARRSAQCLDVVARGSCIAGYVARGLGSPALRASPAALRPRRQNTSVPRRRRLAAVRGASSRGESRAESVGKRAPRRTAVGRQCFVFDGGACAVVRGAECDTCGPSQRTAVAVNECDGA